MTAAFTYAAIYQVDAVCRTPLRTGGMDRDPEQVLRDRDGNALIQGSSLAGALRSWLEAGPDRALAGVLFGCQKQAGRLTVSDGTFEQGVGQQTRSRLSIDPATAVGVDGKKFDVAHIPRKTGFQFTLTWLGRAEETDELAVVERLLSAMDAGAIRLGAQKSNGFGQLSLTVKRCLFDLTNKEDRRAWLADEWEWKTLSLPQLESAQGVVFTVTGRADNILVKTARVVGEKGGSYTSNLAEGGRAILPGSSIKGAVRGRAEYIAKVLGLDSRFTDRYFGRSARAGDNGLPSLVWFEDAELSGRKKKVSRIRVDRFTGSVQRGALFTEEPISTGLTLRITAPEEPALCGLLLYALRDLGLGLYSLGSGWAIGRGQVAVKGIYAAAPDGRRAALAFDGEGGITQEDPSGLFRTWLEALEETRMKVDSDSTQVDRALERGLAMPWAMIRSFSQVTLGPTPRSVDLDELLEARFFSPEAEVRIFRGESGLQTACVEAEEGDVTLERRCGHLNALFGSAVTMRSTLGFDEDGQAYVANTRLTGWEGGEA